MACWGGGFLSTSRSNEMESKWLFAIRRLVAREATWGARKGSRETALREADEQRTGVRNYAIIQLANGRCPPSPCGEIGGVPCARSCSCCWHLRSSWRLPSRLWSCCSSSGWVMPAKRDEPPCSEGGSSVGITHVPNCYRRALTSCSLRVYPKAPPRGAGRARATIEAF